MEHRLSEGFKCVCGSTVDQPWLYPDYDRTADGTYMCVASGQEIGVWNWNKGFISHGSDYERDQSGRLILWTDNDAYTELYKVHTNTFDDPVLIYSTSAEHAIAQYWDVRVTDTPGSQPGDPAIWDEDDVWSGGDFFGLPETWHLRSVEYDGDDKCVLELTGDDSNKTVVFTSVLHS